MENDVLCVQMFGKFSMHYGGRTIAFRKMENAKTIRLLQMLLISGKAGIAKSELADELYGWDESTTVRNRSKNLNKLIYRLREQLTVYGLPEEEYVTVRDGICRFESSFPVSLDTAEFEALCQEAKQCGEEQNLGCLKKANQLYTGELLPMNQTEIWFFESSNYYKELYLYVVRQLIMHYRRQGDYKSLEQLYTKTIHIYPFDGWQTELVRYHLECGKQQEALTLYTETMELYAREMEIPPEEEMQRCFEDYRAKSAKETIIRSLSEDMCWGAYYCTYPSFVDYCRGIRRMQYRRQIGGVLMFLTLNQNPKKENVEKTEQTEQMELLKEAIRLSMRSSDVYTRYGDDGYILLVLNASQVNCCTDIFRRIEDRYHQMGKARGELWYQVVEIRKI